MRMQDFMAALTKAAATDYDVTNDTIHWLTGETYRTIAEAAGRCGRRGWVTVTEGAESTADHTATLQHFRLTDKGRAAI